MPCDTPYYVRIKGRIDEIPLPCGRCPHCKKHRTNSWVFRLQQEDLVSSCSHFITLTYTSDHVPISANGFMTLCKRDLQLFFKRLRKLQQSKIRYYAVGEYGSKRWRPHYHIIMFNLEDEKHLASAWTQGDIHTGLVSGASIGYTCKYIAKPTRIPIHKRDDRVKEFSLMSKGLGASYLTPQKVNYHTADLSRNYVTTPGGYALALPKYYRDKIFDDEQKLFQRKIIVASLDEVRAKHRRDFNDMYGDDDDAYQAYCDSEKRGRYSSYYRSAKERKDL